MDKLIVTLVIAALALNAFAQERDRMHRNGRGSRRDSTHEGGRRRPNPDAKLHRFSTTVEKERPQLNQETRDLIAAYRRNPTEENRAALRKQVAANYDAVVARKKAKLEELKRTECRTEARMETRKAASGYPNVTFRVVREDH